MAQLKLSLLEFLKYVEGTQSSRCVVEGEEVLNADHIILYGITEWNSSVIKVCALCLQTSALQSEPHQISGELKIVDDLVKIVRMFCSCKAGAGGRCKHISAFLILLSRRKLSELEHVSKTELKCAWSSTKGSVKEKYKAIPTSKMPFIAKKNFSIKLTPADSDLVLEYYINNLPNSTIAKHRKRRTPVKVFVPTKILMTIEDKTSLILNNACQSVLIMELSSMKCDFPSVCCEQTLHNILNEETEEMMGISQNSPEWHKARQFRITGSRCYGIFTFSRSNWEIKSKKYFWPKSFSNKFTKHGLRYENALRGLFIEKHSKEVIECGMISFPQNKWLGFSPDGVVIENGEPVALLEIKCLYSGSTSPIEDAILSCPYIVKKDGVCTLKENHQYNGQIQLGMSLLNVQKCFLFLYASFNDTSLTIEVLFDYNFSKMMLEKVKLNYYTKMLHVLCESESK